ncbi:5485_t:CDS:2, partial [Dentiscutata erythropus]
DTINIWNNQISNNEQTEFIVQIKEADEMINDLVFTQPHYEMHPSAIYIISIIFVKLTFSFNFSKDYRENTESLLVIDPFQISQTNSSEEEYDKHAQSIEMEIEEMSNLDEDVGCQWIDVTGLPAQTSHLSDTLNPDGFLCEGSLVLNSSNDLQWELTNYTTSYGYPVSRVKCNFIKNWDSNNYDYINYTLHNNLSFVTEPCTRGQSGPLRDW